MMLRKTAIAISAALVLSAASTAFALEGRDGDNNPFPSGSGVVQRGVPASIGGNVFAGPRFVAKRHARIHARRANRHY
jgi:hypothetical protein